MDFPGNFEVGWPIQGHGDDDELGSLVMSGFTGFVGVERKCPPELRGPQFAAYCVKDWKKLAPLHRWSIEHVG